VTAKEKLHLLVDRLSDGEAEHARIVLEDGPGSSLEEWGDLDAQMDVAMAGSLRELDEEERKDGFPPWNPERPT
jgi:hypothetical protein